MNSWQFNKISGAVLGTIFLMFGGSLVAEGIFHPEKPETPGYEIVVAESGEGGEGGAEAEAVAPIAARLQNANLEAGASDFRKCSACHSADPDGANQTGPGLWGVVDRPIASHEGFDYSSAMADFSEGGSVVWDYEHLDHFLENPKSYISGTKMGFAGIRDPQDRADTILYLRSLAENPAPLPEAPAEGEAVAEAGAGDTQNPGTTSNMSASDEASNPQAPGTTDPDTGSAMPGQDQAPVLSDENQPETRANEVQEQDAPAADGAAESATGSDDQAAAAGGDVVAVSGDPEAGANIFRRCQACHKVGEGAGNGIGPELNGVLSEKPAAVEGYSFSAAFTEWAADKDQWTHELMSEWLADPRGTVSGTKMAFAGLKSQEDIDNVIAYLNQFNEDGSQK
ncbi:hypothetical protein DYI37_01010 [Fulvimarina endophytica]|uniref:Cytochrome c domain-containing protein n=1 Tax=Fulvimarina endophytica TaxID=2293836 RepID=A0A371XA32_9HYPH|nr:c-type cytochrome [Fulvimarina endophytica]RFC66080.1 hypothetical protein DYI37_01010 [Fulvimarina endophytica]